MTVDHEAASCRSWWQNCAQETDAEMLAIDRMEDRLEPLDPKVTQVRGLISTLELCHHKAERWVENMVEAIGTGETSKGLGTRPPGPPHPAEEVWRNACAALSGWCAGCSAVKAEPKIGAVPASQLRAGLGRRSPLKEWQVRRVIEKIRSVISFPWSSEDPAAQYVWLLLSVGDEGVGYHDQCPEHYREHEDFWRATARTLIRDTEGGDEADLSLALAIDMLWPCHWRFVDNLQIVLAAIGGNLHPEEPFSACGRNINLLPNRSRMEITAHTLRAFCGDPLEGREADHDLLERLGEPTEVKAWLAASLDKTIRLQLDPPAGLRAMVALDGPEWVRQE